MVKKEQLDILFESIETGLNVSDSCVLANISRETYYKRLKADLKFEQAITQAQITSKKRAIKIIHDAAIKHWQAAAWWLERKHRNEFGVNQDVRVSSGQEIIEQWKKELGIEEESLKISENWPKEEVF